MSDAVKTGLWVEDAKFDEVLLAPFGRSYSLTFWQEEGMLFVEWRGMPIVLKPGEEIRIKNETTHGE